MQGLAGLQLQKATRLTWDRVDLERGLIEISGEVKNEYRNRVIPVAQRLLAALRRAQERQKGSRARVQDIRAPVVVSEKGLPYGDWWHNYSKEISVALRTWNPGIDWKPKDLRNALPTSALMQGVLNDVWEQYLGHAPRTLTARHYIPRLASRSGGETQALEREMALFRLQVIEPLERGIACEKASRICNFLQQEDPSQRVSCR